MKRSPNLRPTPWDGIVAAAVVLLAAACVFSAQTLSNGTDALTVVISTDGQVTERVPLADFPDQPQILSANGYTLYLSRDPAADADAAGVRVTASDCPTQDCVHTGTITRSGQSIVCLPARVIITLEGAAPDDGGPDLVVG